MGPHAPLDPSVDACARPLQRPFLAGFTAVRTTVRQACGHLCERTKQPGTTDRCRQLSGAGGVVRVVRVVRVGQVVQAVQVVTFVRDRSSESVLVLYWNAVLLADDAAWKWSVGPEPNRLRLYAERTQTGEELWSANEQSQSYVTRIQWRITQLGV